MESPTKANNLRLSLFFHLFCLYDRLVREEKYQNAVPLLIRLN